MNIELPSIRNYGEYKSDNYGAHTLMVTVGQFTVFFSYKTPVAFTFKGRRIVSENIWTRTTGKHLNWIDGKSAKDRVPHEVFEKLYQIAQNNPDITYEAWERTIRETVNEEQCVVNALAA